VIYLKDIRIKDGGSDENRKWIWTPVLDFISSLPFLSTCRTWFYTHHPWGGCTADVPLLRGRGIECSRFEGNGPQIKITSPKLDEPLLTPFVVDIAFEAFSNKIIDYESLRIKYLRLVPIDLTSRVKPYLNNNRLMLKGVKVPQGRHCLQLLISYTSGEKTLMEIILNVEK
jgi:hypothetical protein